MNDLNHFHFVELVLANQTARVFAVRTRLAAETGRMRGQLQRQLFGRDNAVGNGIGQGNFGCRNQVLGGFGFVAATGNVEQIFRKFW